MIPDISEEPELWLNFASELTYLDKLLTPSPPWIYLLLLIRSNQTYVPSVSTAGFQLIVGEAQKLMCRL